MILVVLLACFEFANDRCGINLQHRTRHEQGDGVGSGVVECESCRDAEHHSSNDVHAVESLDAQVVALIPLCEPHDESDASCYCIGPAHPVFLDFEQRQGDHH